MLFVALLAISLPAYGGPSATANKTVTPKKEVTQPSFVYSTPYSPFFSVSMTTAQVMQQGTALARTCDGKPASKTALKQNVGPVSILATYLDTGSILGNVSGDVAPGQALLGMDSRIRTFCHSGDTLAADQVLDLTVEQFFSSVNNGYYTSQPSVLFDQTPPPAAKAKVGQPAPKWYIAATTISTDHSTTRLLLAVGDNPITLTSNWTFIVVDTGNSPAFQYTSEGSFAGAALGIDQSYLYLSVRARGNQDILYNSNSLYVIDKTAPTGTMNAFFAVTEAFGGVGCGEDPGCPTGPTGLQPAVNFDAFDGLGYVLSVANSDFFASASAGYGTGGSQGQILYQTVDTTSSPMTLSAPIQVLVDAYQASVPVALTPPANAPEAVPARAIAPLSINLDTAHKRGGYVYTSQLVGVDSTGISNPTVTVNPDRNAVRWYRVSTNVTPTTNTNEIYDNSTSGTALSYFTPSIMTDSSSNVFIGASTNGLILGAADGYYSSTITQPTGGYQTIPPTVISASNTPYYPTEDWFEDPAITPAGRTRTTIDSTTNTIWPFLPYGYAQGVWGVATAPITALGPVKKAGK